MAAYELGYTAMNCCFCRIKFLLTLSFLSFCIIFCTETTLFYFRQQLLSISYWQWIRLLSYFSTLLFSSFLPQNRGCYISPETTASLEVSCFSFLSANGSFSIFPMQWLFFYFSPDNNWFAFLPSNGKLLLLPQTTAVLLPPSHCFIFPLANDSSLYFPNKVGFWFLAPLFPQIWDVFIFLELFICLETTFISYYPRNGDYFLFFLRPRMFFVPPQITAVLYFCTGKDCFSSSVNKSYVFISLQGTVAVLYSFPNNSCVFSIASEISKRILLHLRYLGGYWPK